MSTPLTSEALALHNALTSALRRGDNDEAVMNALPPYKVITFGQNAATLIFALANKNVDGATTQTALPSPTDTTMVSPQSFRDFNTPSPPNQEHTSMRTIFVVLQHSLSAGHSALLPITSIMGLFFTREEAVEQLKALPRGQIPAVKRKVGGGDVRQGLRFWCTAGEGEGDVDGDLGFSYAGASGEEFLVWVEEHQVAF